MQKKTSISILNKVLLVLLAVLVLGSGFCLELGFGQVAEETKVEQSATEDTNSDQQEGQFVYITDQVSQTPSHYSFQSFFSKINAEIPLVEDQPLSITKNLADYLGTYIKTLLTCIISPNAP